MNKPWIDTIRRTSGLVEHICEHGVGHPAYGSVHWMKLHGHDGYGVHGCDGCCQSTEWIIADLREGLEIANKLLKSAIERNRRFVEEIARLASEKV